MDPYENFSKCGSHDQVLGQIQYNNLYPYKDAVDETYVPCVEAH